MNILELQLKEFLRLIRSAKYDKKKLEVLEMVYQLGISDGLNEVNQQLRKRKHE